MIDRLLAVAMSPLWLASASGAVAWWGVHALADLVLRPSLAAPSR